jgi:hypothetical protein
MMEKRIWALAQQSSVDASGGRIFKAVSRPWSHHSHGDAIEYIRIDLMDEAVKALEQCRDELDDYSKQEYPYDHPVHERNRRRDYESNTARLALAKLKEQTVNER